MDAPNRKYSPLSVNGVDPAVASFIQGDRKVLHHRILQTSQSIPSLQGGLVAIYQKEVLPQKTRTVRLLGIKSPAKIIQTLLGYEVQARYKRIQCPDLVTARYIRLFSELGCRSIRLPYDPTITARLISTMEQALQSITDTVSGLFPENPRLCLYIIRKIYSILRTEIRDLT
jgi:hypothetical protein